LDADKDREGAPEATGWTEWASRSIACIDPVGSKQQLEGREKSARGMARGQERARREVEMGGARLVRESGWAIDGTVRLYMY
jgi:hypothetical protein